MGETPLKKFKNKKVFISIEGQEDAAKASTQTAATTLNTTTKLAVGSEIAARNLVTSTPKTAKLANGSSYVAAAPSNTATHCENLAVSPLGAATHHGDMSAPYTASSNNLAVSPLHPATHHGATLVPPTTLLAVSPLCATICHGATLAPTVASSWNIGVSPFHVATHHGATSAPPATRLAVLPLHGVTYHGAMSAPPMACLTVLPLRTATDHGATLALLVASFTISSLDAVPNNASLAVSPLTLARYIAKTLKSRPHAERTYQNPRKALKMVFSSPKSIGKHPKSPKIGSKGSRTPLKVPKPY